MCFDVGGDGITDLDQRAVLGVEGILIVFSGQLFVGGFEDNAVFGDGRLEFRSEERRVGKEGASVCRVR